MEVFKGSFDTDTGRIDFDFKNIVSTYPSDDENSYMVMPSGVHVPIDFDMVMQSYYIVEED